MGRLLILAAAALAAALILSAVAQSRGEPLPPACPTMTVDDFAARLDDIADRIGWHVRIPAMSKSQFVASLRDDADFLRISAECFRFQQRELRARLLTPQQGENR